MDWSLLSKARKQYIQDNIEVDIDEHMMKKTVTKLLNEKSCGLERIFAELMKKYINSTNTYI